MRKNDYTLVLSLIFTLFLASGAFAYQNYTELGGRNSYFQTGFSQFDIGYSTYNVVGNVISGTQTPLVADLNNDNINDIVVLSGSNLRIYNTEDLIVASQVTLPNISSRYSNMLIYDIDNDGILDLLISPSTGSRYVFRYNLINTTLTLINSIYVNSISGLGETLIQCKAPENCVMLVTDSITINFGDGGASVYATMFNSTGAKNFTNTLYTESATMSGACNSAFITFCFPKIPKIVVADYDGDLSNEYLFNMLISRPYTPVCEVDKNEYMAMFAFNMNDAGVASIERRIKQKMNNAMNNGDGNAQCDVEYPSFGSALNQVFPGNLITSPLVLSDGTTISAYQRDDNSFQMRAYANTPGNHNVNDGANTCGGLFGSPVCLDNYPENADANGDILSNPILANVMPQSANKEFCIMGQDKINRVVDLNCGSLNDVYFACLVNRESIDFQANATYNLTNTYGLYNSLIHTINANDDLTEGVNLDDILTPYGTFKIDYSILVSPTPAICGVGTSKPIYNLKPLWVNPKQNGGVISVDIQKNEKEDLLEVTGTNVFYIDDAYQNKAPFATFHYESNPCTDKGAIHTNETMTIMMFAHDPDEADLTARRVQIYYGSSNEIDSGWSENYSQGTEIPFTAVLNKTTLSGTIKYSVRDNYDPVNNVQTQSVPFSVSDTGLIFAGDCITRRQGIISQEEQDVINQQPQGGGGNGTPKGCTGAGCNLLPDTGDNPITGALVGINNALGGGLGLTVLWVIIMIGAGVAVVMGAGANQTLAIASLIFIEVGLIIVGTILGFLPIGWIIVFALVAILVIGFWLRDVITGS